MELNRTESAAGVVLDSLKAIIQTVKDEIKRLRKTLRQLITQSPDLSEKQELVRSIPSEHSGIGEKTALVLLAELEKARYLQTSREAAAFAGLVPRVYESGSSVGGRSSLSKQGCESACARRCTFRPSSL